MTLSVRDLEVRFKTHKGQVAAVNGLSYEVEAGKAIGIVGESGSGKSVSSLAIMGLLPKAAAVVGSRSHMSVEGTDLRRLSVKEWRRFRGRQLGMIFQDPMTSLNPFLTIGKQLTEGVRYHVGLSAMAAQKKAEQMLEYVALADAPRILSSYPHELSGGMRQRVMIAMALMAEPKLIFADEPTTALDVTVQVQILKLFKDLRRRFSTALVLISHDLAVIASECDEVLVMYAGQMMERGSPEDIFDNPLHPYTQALKDSVPRIDADHGGDIEAIEGQPPDPLNLPKGCPFADRCAYAMEQCRQKPVPLANMGSGREVRCLLMQKRGAA